MSDQILHDDLKKVKTSLLLNVHEILQYCPQEKYEEKLKKTKELMLSLCQAEQEISAETKCIQSARQQRKKTDYKEQTFKETYDLLYAAEKKKFSDPKNHQSYKTLQQLIEQEAVQSSPNDQDELVVTEADINTIDPVTKTQFVDPVKNRNCGHTYSKDSVLLLLKKKRGGIRCPVVGCANPAKFTEKDLEPDVVMQKLIEQSKKK